MHQQQDVTHSTQQVSRVRYCDVACVRHDVRVGCFMAESKKQLREE